MADSRPELGHGLGEGKSQIHMLHQLRRETHLQHRLARVALSVATCLVLLASSQLAPASAATPPAPADTYFPSTGYAVSNPTIWAFVQQHGGVNNLGSPISNVFTLGGNQVQLFERQAVQVHPNGTVDELPLVGGDYLPLSAVLGVTNVPDPALVAALPAPGPDFYKKASAYLDRAAPNVWNGQQVGFGATWRGSISCQAACDPATQFNLTADLWGLPVSSPVADPRNPDLTYLWFQRGVLVHSRSANQNQWLLAGQLFKQVLLGTNVAPDMLAQVSSSPTTARFYAQYDPLARDGLARGRELPGASLQGAFLDPAGTNASASVSAAAASAAAPRPAAPASNLVPAPGVPLAPPRPTGQLDTRFGVAEGFRDAGMMSSIQAGWERIVIPWDAVQPQGPTDFSQLGLTMPNDRLQAEVQRGAHVSAVLQFTPTWAQSNPAVGQRSVPRNLNLPFDDPNNYWGQFVYQTVKHYAGQIDEWILWNEPEFRPGDPGAGGSYTWAGTDEEFAQLMRVGYLAAKKANPQAVVSFPATSYWVEELSVPKRTPFYDRVLGALAKDQRAAQNSFYHDAVSVNLYRSPDDVYRVADVFKGIERKYGVDKQLWLTEMNATPSEDPQVVCGTPPPSFGVKTSLEEQASYAIQGFALAAAAGYRHAEVYKMVDGDACNEPAWGLVRGDGSHRPIADATKVAINYFSNFLNVQFAPLTRDQEHWPSWPANPSSYTPNWQVYNVVLDRPGNQRVTALWNGDGSPLRVRIPKNGTTAKVVDRRGVEQPAVEQDGAWVVDLPAATAQFQGADGMQDPEGYHFIGGAPVLLVAEGVDPASPVSAPKLG